MTGLRGRSHRDVRAMFRGSMSLFTGFVYEHFLLVEKKKKTGERSFLSENPVNVLYSMNYFQPYSVLFEDACQSPSIGSTQP